MKSLKKKLEREAKGAPEVGNFRELRVAQNVMRMFQPDKEVQVLENKLGEFRQVSKKQRNWSMIVNSVVDNLTADLQG